jgi:cellulose synthase/poly-beta-1,6-N-acetylglucosamine synthase-like glycosyltransferase/DNA-binding response OmpR family regulator
MTPLLAPPAAAPESSSVEEDRPGRRDTVLVLHEQADERVPLAGRLRDEGYLALQAENVHQAREQFRQARPDLVLLPGDAGGLEALELLREDPDGGQVSVIVLTHGEDLTTLLRAFELGADDVVSQSADWNELRARIRARLDRRSVPRDVMLRDPVTGALTHQTLARMLRMEVERVRRVRRPACLAYLAFHELPTVEAELGQRARDEILAQVVDIVEADGRQLDLVGFSRHHLALLLPDTPAKGGRARLNRLAQKLYRHTFRVDGQDVQLTPVVGFAAADPGTGSDAVEQRAWTALMHSAEQLDLYPTQWRAHLEGAADSRPGGVVRRFLSRHRTALQVVATQLACFGIPLLWYVAMDRMGIDVTGTVYLVVVVVLALTSLALWAECLSAYRPKQPPEHPAQPYPPASAIIAAYLPNEADTIVETVEAFLKQDYEPLQIILAYNTPHDLPVEDELRAIAQRDPRFVPMRIRGSVSKAQNVNAALASVTGEFVGVFDADHHPAPGSFERAWRWLADGADVVQGHCMVRNGEDGFLQRLVAAEFESMYAVGHPGRARVHGFGIFGGSNGYWRTAVLRETRMRGFMLTEDIDSSMRVVSGGGRIVSDPGLVSTELSPPNWKGLWGQRLRWAQGWSQVSLGYLFSTLRNRRLTGRQRLGFLYLLGWRELYPWLSLQTYPILAYWFLRGRPPVEWFVPVFVFTTLLTFSSGFAQAWTAWRLAAPELRRRGRWFLVFGLCSQLFYNEYKNVIARTAHLKEAMRERKWKVTPRATRVDPALERHSAPLGVPAQEPA